MKARLPDGMGKGPSNLNGLMRQAQKMQEEMEALKEEFSEKEFTVNAGGGAVTLVINGDKKVLSLEIQPEIVDPDDVETLQDIIIAAVNEGIGKVESEYNESVEKITGNSGMSIPGLI